MTTTLNTMKHADADSLSCLPLAEDDDADTVASIFTVSLIGNCSVCSQGLVRHFNDHKIQQHAYRYAITS